MTSNNIAYSIVDVFTKTPFSGNPLAVIHDASQLSDSQMQSIATEFGFSETSFILPPFNSTVSARVRIFTPMEEIPFAGHPTIGTAFVIATQDTVIEKTGLLQELSFALLGGYVAISLQTSEANITGAKISAPQTLKKIGYCDPELVANCLGISSNNIITDRIKPCVATIGLPFAFVGVVDLATLADIKMNIASFHEAKARGPETVDGFAICVFAVLSESDNTITLQSRVLSPLGHPAEDPATGSASGALGALLTPCERNKPYQIIIKQGVEMGRPSDITVEMATATSKPTISGDCVHVSSGTLHL